MVCAALGTTTAMAATEQQKLDAINNGLANLYTTQQAGGFWSYGGYEPAATGAAVLAFVSQKDKWGANATDYQTAVDKAVAYLLNAATKTTVSTRNDLVNICPGGAASCDAVYWNAANNEDSYTTGLIMPALMTYAAGKAGDVATNDPVSPLVGMKWGEIAQANTNLWAASQSTLNQGANRIGGWRYVLGGPQYDSDMSTTQWGIISLIYNENFGATTPAIVRTDLAKWLTTAQNVSGAGCYQPNVYCDHSDTGGLLLGLKFLGKTTADSAVQAALGFLNTNWTQTANGTWFGNFGHPYAMWSVYKGLEVNIGLDNTSTITNLLTTCGAPDNLPGNPSGSKPCNWWEDYNQSLVETQNTTDGSWPGYVNWYGPLATAFNVNILGATPIPVENRILDDFNRTTSSKPIRIIGPDWPHWSGATGIKQYALEGFLENDQWNGKVEPDGSLPIYWNKTKFDVNQEAFVTLTALDLNGIENDLLLKVQTSSTGVINYKRGVIEVFYSPSKKEVRVATLLPNKTWKDYEPTPVEFIAGDKFGASALADGTVHIYKNGTDVAVQELDAQDQAFFNTKGGYIGLWFISTPDAYFDDFGGGNL